MSYIDPTASMRRQVTREMGRVRVQRAGFRRLEVRINRYTSPPSARAEFTGFVQAKDLRGEIPYENFVHPFTVRLIKQGDRWLLTDYEIHNMPRGGL